MISCRLRGRNSEGRERFTGWEAAKGEAGGAFRTAGGLGVVEGITVSCFNGAVEGGVAGIGEEDANTSFSETRGVDAAGLIFHGTFLSGVEGGVATNGPVTCCCCCC